MLPTLNQSRGTQLLRETQVCERAKRASLDEDEHASQRVKRAASEASSKRSELVASV